MILQLLFFLFFDADTPVEVT